MATVRAFHWACGNRDCGFTAVLMLPEGVWEAPVCVCGSRMRNVEPQPACSSRDFLRSEGVLRRGQEREKES